MVKIKDIAKKISSLHGYKIIFLLMIIGLALLIVGNMIPRITSNKTGSAENVKKTEQEEKLAGILSQMEGVGEVEVSVFTKDNTSSVVVLAEGANDPTVNLKIRRTVRTLMQTDDSNIKIEKKKS